MPLLLSPFFERHRVVLSKGTDGCVESTFVIPQDGYVTKYGSQFGQIYWQFSDDIIDLFGGTYLKGNKFQHLHNPIAFHITDAVTKFRTGLNF